MTYEELIESMEHWSEDKPTPEHLELATDAVAFTQGLHATFKDSGMTSTTDIDLNQLENLFDSLLGELGAACLFLSAPSFERVPDMLRAIGSQLEKQDREDVPLVVKKGFERLAIRIENTRVQMQQLVQTSVAASDKT